MNSNKNNAAATNSDSKTTTTNAANADIKATAATASVGDNAMPVENAWRFWHYECNDWPVIRSNMTSAKRSAFGYMVEQLIRQLSALPTYESNEKWLTDYIRKGPLFIGTNSQSMLKAFKRELRAHEHHEQQQEEDVPPPPPPLLPTQMASVIFFNKKVGIACFREGVPPDYYHPQNDGNSHFQMLLTATTDDATLLQQFNAFFWAALKIMASSGNTMLPMLNGIFLRCEVNPGKKLCKNNFNISYRDHRNLPCLFKLEIWFGKVNEQEKAQIQTQITDRILAEAERIIGRHDDGMCHFGNFTQLPAMVFARIKRQIERCEQQAQKQQDSTAVAAGDGTQQWRTAITTNNAKYTQAQHITPPFPRPPFSK